MREVISQKNDQIMACTMNPISNRDYDCECHDYRIVQSPCYSYSICLRCFYLSTGYLWVFSIVLSLVVACHYNTMHMFTFYVFKEETNPMTYS